MGKSFDFNKIKRDYFTVTAKNGQVLQLKMPVKHVFEKLIAFENINEKTGSTEVMTALDVICAEILSNNTAETHIKPEDIANGYDLEEKIVFINAYMEFVSEAKNNPN